MTEDNIMFNLEKRQERMSRTVTLKEEIANGRRKLLFVVSIFIILPMVIVL
jgi:hypothetical protein